MGSAIAKALDYSLKRWQALTRYLEDGHVPIDNNWVENQVRPEPFIKCIAYWLGPALSKPVAGIDIQICGIALDVIELSEEW